MKKLILILAAIMVLAFAGCGEDKTNNKKIENITREETQKVENVQAPSDTEEQPPAEEEEPEQDSKQETEIKTEKPSAKSLADIRSEIKGAVSASGAMDLDLDAISGLYGINASDMVQAVGFVVMEGTFPHEAVMVEAKDSAAANNVERLLNAKHESFVAQSKGYDPENYALAQKCKVERNGNYISMFLTPDFEAMKAVYTKYIK